jgi:hypothetical protein
VTNEELAEAVGVLVGAREDDGSLSEIDVLAGEVLSELEDSALFRPGERMEDLRKLILIQASLHGGTSCVGNLPGS